jgi:hypothetical protein
MEQSEIFLPGEPVGHSGQIIGHDALDPLFGRTG